MNIGFYGHSAASWSGHEKSFIDQIKNKLNANIVNLGVPQGSEERILFDLKKTKHLDIAVIFHAPGEMYSFIPKCNRDLSVASVPENKAKIFWDEEDEDAEVSKEQFENEFFNYGRIKEVFGDADTFITCMKMYKRFLYHPDLARNRFMGAVLYIDNYCCNLNLKVIHVIDTEKSLPPWFTFKSGIVGNKVYMFSKEHYDPGNNPNNISDIGNSLIADELIRLINEI
jgi:hypothetical protein